MANPPWIKKTEPLFKKEEPKQSDKPNPYNNYKWQQQSGRFFRGKKCANPNCIRLAYCTDHIVRLESGGAMWDKRNWEQLCKPCHDKKRGKERHGYTEESVDTPHGKIPKRREHLPPDIAGGSYLIKPQ